MGGAQVNLLHILEGMDRSQIEPHLVCSREDFLTREARRLGLEARVIRLVPWLKMPYWPRIPFCIGRLVRYIRRARIVPWPPGESG